MPKKRQKIPTLFTPGRIATLLGVPIHRVIYVLRTRKHIRPSARAGIYRIYDSAAIAKVRHELNAQDARRYRIAKNEVVDIDQISTPPQTEEDAPASDRF